MCYSFYTRYAVSKKTKANSNKDGKGQRGIDQILAARIEECLRNQVSPKRKRKMLPLAGGSVKSKKKKAERKRKQPMRVTRNSLKDMGLDDPEEVNESMEVTEVKVEESINYESDNDDFNDMDNNDTVDDDCTNEVGDTKNNVDSGAKIENEKKLKQEKDQNIAESKTTTQKNRKVRKRSVNAHKCAECDKSFSRLYRLFNHLDTVHDGIKRYHCAVCGIMLSRNDHVTRHMKSKHSNLSEYNCDLCPASFTTIHEIVSHGLMHKDYREKQDPLKDLSEQEKEVVFVSCEIVGQREYGCKLCSSVFKELYKAREHANIHLELKPFECGECPSRFHRRATLTKHQQQKHSEVALKCPKCNKRYQSIEIYEAHVESCEKQHVCQECGSAFYSTVHLKKHNLSVHGEKTHQCHICTKAFPTKFRLTSHISYTHEGKARPNKEIICDICGLSFQGTHKMKRHMSVHTGVKDYKCDQCHKQYLDSNSLKNHMMTVHLKVKPFVCEICAMEFTVKSNMLRHLRRHRGEYRFFCEDCGKGFIANCDLTRHKLTHNPSKGESQ